MGRISRSFEAIDPDGTQGVTDAFAHPVIHEGGCAEVIDGVAHEFGVGGGRKVQLLDGVPERFGRRVETINPG